MNLPEPVMTLRKPVMHIPEAVMDFKQLPAKQKKKIKKYYAHQVKKHGDRTVDEIREKVASKFNLNFVENGNSV